MHEERDPLRTPNYVFYREEADKILNTTLKNEQSRRDSLITVDIIFRSSGDQKFKKLYEEFT
jgi:hypothetical protein